VKLGICAGPGTWRQPPPGLDFIEANVQGLLKPQADEDAFAPQLAAAQSAPRPILAANCFLPGSLPCTGPNVNVEDLDSYVRTALSAPSCSAPAGRGACPTDSSMLKPPGS